MTEIEVVAPNLSRRLSGVTATIVRLVPLMAKEMGVVATGPGLPPHVPHVSFVRAATLSRDRWRVWHARRNIEMLFGVVLRHIFRRRYRLLFTSASQRRHTGYTRWLISKMDAVIATSGKSADYLERSSTVILHGIDTVAFRPPAHREEVRRRLRLPEGILVGCFGRIRPRKGTDVFLDAMIPLLKRRADVHALVLGRPTEKFRNYRKDLENRVHEAGVSGQVSFLPEVPTHMVADWYSALDLYVAPQRWEGFGLTPLEAMACGVPVVATTVGAFPEIVPAGAGRLVPPNEVDPMAEAISEIAEDSTMRAALSRTARKHVVDHFALDGEAKAIMKIYRDLLN